MGKKYLVEEESGAWLYGLALVGGVLYGIYELFKYVFGLVVSAYNYVVGLVASAYNYVVGLVVSAYNYVYGLVVSAHQNHLLEIVGLVVSLFAIALVLRKRHRTRTRAAIVTALALGEQADRERLAIANSLALREQADRERADREAYRRYEQAYRAHWGKVVAVVESDKARLGEWEECYQEVMDLHESQICEEDIRRRLMLGDRYERAVAMSVLDFVYNNPHHDRGKEDLYRRLEDELDVEYFEAIFGDARR